MIKNIIKTLSDTELIAISKEIIDPTIPNITIYRQLEAKRNNDITNDDDFNDLESIIINELSLRLLEVDERLGKLQNNCN